MAVQLSYVSNPLPPPPNSPSALPTIFHCSCKAVLLCVTSLLLLLPQSSANFSVRTLLFCFPTHTTAEFEKARCQRPCSGDQCVSESVPPAYVPRTHLPPPFLASPPNLPACARRPPTHGGRWLQSNARMRWSAITMLFKHSYHHQV